MPLSSKYNPNEAEPRLHAFWHDGGIYHFNPDDDRPIYSIDTPPATVSGDLHLGHVYSYSHTDFIARFKRMKGWNVFYPMGFDDNGLPTERLVEKRRKIKAIEIGRRAFINNCLQVSEEVEQAYRNLWQRLGLSIDWRYSYRTIDEHSRRVSQLSFIDLYKKGLVYLREAPAIWCPECQTSIAQADLNDLDQETEFITLSFGLVGGGSIRIATTRPELLPACVAIFVHPSEERYKNLVGRSAIVPIFGQVVPILADPSADPEKGTGIVMCCTFGDTTDVAWWHIHNLPLLSAIGRNGSLTEVAGEYAGLPVKQARAHIKETLQKSGEMIGVQRINQSIRVHERCDTPVEYIVTKQWFIRILDNKKTFLEEGEKVNWYPDYMRARYQSWVENLNWDWCISRQRYYGVPFPIWYCTECGEVILAEEGLLPVDPLEITPQHPCPKCQSRSFKPEQDVLDTWATSSMTPQIVGQWLKYPPLYEKVFPFSLRPQAHEIIRTWAFYTILKSYYHFGQLPWKDVAISGWGIAGEGMGKISKSRGGGSLPPLEMINHYSADAVRYWAASAGPGKDAVISEEKIQIGAKLVTKLWNVARFAERFISTDIKASFSPSALTPADHWILSRLQRLIQRATSLLDNYDYAMAKSEVETFFWTELADNYLEMCKQRLYSPKIEEGQGARYTLYHTLLSVIKLFAPILPYVTEEIYQGIFSSSDGSPSIHTSHWPDPDLNLMDEFAEKIGNILVKIATSVRRYKSEQNISLGSELSWIQIVISKDIKQDNNLDLENSLRDSVEDIASVTRARKIEITRSLSSELEVIGQEENYLIGVKK
jgi:valyl-tRNA synthetase